MTVPTGQFQAKLRIYFLKRFEKQKENACTVQNAVALSQTQ